MDKQTLDLMRAFDESVWQFKQFNTALTQLKTNLDDIAGELNIVLELAEADELNDKMKQSVMGLQSLTAELQQIKQRYDEVLHETNEEKQALTQAFSQYESELKQLRLQLKLALSHLGTSTSTKRFVTVEEATRYEVPLKSQLLSQSGTKLLHHNETHQLLLVTKSGLQEVLAVCPSDVALDGMMIYFRDEANLLISYHVLEKVTQVIAENVSQFLIRQDELIYLQQEEIVVRSLNE